MAGIVLYFGPDEWNRVQVLESAGYAVCQCLKISDLESELKKSPHPAAVVVNGFAHASFKPAVELLHTQAASARIIAFPGPGESGFEKSVDLVVPPLTPPEEWLREMAELLSQTRATLEQAISIQGQPPKLIERMAEVGKKPATRVNLKALQRRRRS